jgi:hypothetical protein
MRWVANSPDSNTRIVPMYIAVVATKKERTTNSHAPLMAHTVRDFSPKTLMAEFHIREAASTSASTPKVKPPPKTSKIPSQFFYGPSDDGTDENLLIFLHGLGMLDRNELAYASSSDCLFNAGDTHISFTKLGKALKLPQTAVLSLRAPEQ